MATNDASIYKGQTSIIPVVNSTGGIFVESQTSTGQSIFTIASFQYTPGTFTLKVYKNGLRQQLGVDYVESNATQVAFAAAVGAGQLVTFEAFAIQAVVLPNGGGVIPAGLTGQVLAKKSASDYDLQWLTLNAITTLLDAPLQSVALQSVLPLNGALALATRNIQITGNGTLTGCLIAAGQVWAVTFNGTINITNSANLQTRRNGDITTYPGDTCFFRAVADNQIEILCYSSQFLPVKNGGTGTDGGQPWTQVGCVISAVTGAFADASAVARYQKIGRTVFFNLVATINANGTAGGAVVITTPWTIVGESGWAGRENQATGVGIIATGGPNSPNIILRTVSNGYPGGTGYRMTVNGVLEASA